MSLLDRLDVPAAPSRASSSATDRPRLAASSAAPAPVTPPPITRTSTTSSVSRARSARRRSGESLPRSPAAEPSEAGRRPVQDGGPVRAHQLAGRDERGLALLQGQFLLAGAEDRG